MMLKRSFLVFLLALALVAGLFSPVLAKSQKALFPIVENDLWGYIDKTGHVVVKPQYERTSTFAEGRGMVRTLKPQRKTFCVDVKGNRVFEVKENWNYFSPFHEGLASVKDSKAGLYGYVDVNGKVTIPFQFTSAADFKEGLAKVEKKQGDRWVVGFINTKGKVVIPFDQNLKTKCSDGYIRFRAETKEGFRYGFMDKSGKTVLPAHFKQAGNFVDGVTIVNDGQTLMIINKKGKTLAKLPFDAKKSSSIPDFHDGYAKAPYAWKFPDGKWGIIDTKGKRVFKNLKVSAMKTKFSQERAWIKLSGSKDFVLIDVNGKVYTKVPDAQEAMEFQYGLSALMKKKEKRVYYFNKSGKQVY